MHQGSIAFSHSPWDPESLMEETDFSRLAASQQAMSMGLRREDSEK
jgi:hypothetical protein